jgi:ferredoxin-type protein NapF
MSGRSVAPSRRQFLGLAKSRAPRAAIGDACLAVRGIFCNVCRDQCAADAIRFAPVRGGAPQPRLDVSLCTGCGDCLAACPAQAITLASLRYREQRWT